MPAEARAIVILFHGGASGRHTPADQFIAAELTLHGLATMLVDLLTPEEQASDKLDGALRFDLGVLTQRLETVIDWVRHARGTRSMAIGLLAAGTAAAAALTVAAARPDRIAAVMSRGGRPDLAGIDLPRVTTPALFVVGQKDLAVVGLNQAAAHRLGGLGEIATVRGAGHLFDEPGALEELAQLAVGWFSRFLLGAAAAATPPGASSR